MNSPSRYLPVIALCMAYLSSDLLLASSRVCAWLWDLGNKQNHTFLAHPNKSET